MIVRKVGLIEFALWDADPGLSQACELPVGTNGLVHSPGRAGVFSDLRTRPGQSPGLGLLVQWVRRGCTHASVHPTKQSPTGGPISVSLLKTTPECNSVSPSAPRRAQDIPSVGAVTPECNAVPDSHRSLMEVLGIGPYQSRDAIPRTEPSRQCEAETKWKRVSTIK